MIKKVIISAVAGTFILSGIIAGATTKQTALDPMATPTPTATPKEKKKKDKRKRHQPKARKRNRNQAPPKVQRTSRKHHPHRAGKG